MKQYETPDFVKINFATENVLDDSIVDGSGSDNPVVVGPPIDIFG